MLVIQLMRFIAVLIVSLCVLSMGFSQDIRFVEQNQSSDSWLDDKFFIFVGVVDDYNHIVWDENQRYDVVLYTIERSYDREQFRPIEQIVPEDLFDISANNFPKDYDYSGIFYSTETGWGRFVYNDVFDRNKKQTIWYRIKMQLADSSIIYTRAESNDRGTSGETLEIKPEEANPNGPAIFRGPSASPGSSASGNRRRPGCPNIETPPAGYSWTGVSQIYYGDCCYWEEREYRLDRVSAPCGASTVWCCDRPGDCAASNIVFDWCCVHPCNEYSQCSCVPWNCCDLTNAVITIVSSVNNYTITVTVDATQDITCNGENGGAVTLSVNGGVPPYDYAWDNGVTTGTGLSALVAGNYALTVTDLAGCDEGAQFIINQPPPLTTDITNLGNSCFGMNDGAIDLAVTGGTPPYTFSWNNGAYSTEDLNNLTPGHYNVTVTDINGCSTTDATSFVGPDEFTGAINIESNVDCYGWNSGSAVLLYSGGTPGFTFAWSNGSVDPGISNLPAGNYSVTATDANGCSFVDAAVITSNTEIMATITSSDATCGACNGSATINATGG